MINLILNKNNSIQEYFKHGEQPNFQEEESIFTQIMFSDKAKMRLN